MAKGNKKGKKVSRVPLRPPTAVRPSRVRASAPPTPSRKANNRFLQGVADLYDRGRRLFGRGLHIHLGSAVRFTVSAGVVVWGGATQFGILNEPILVWGWVVLWFIDVLLTRIKRGTALREYSDAVERVNSSTAGAIDNLARYMRSRPSQRVTHDEALGVIECLLASVRDYATLAFRLGADHQVRVSLAVPLRPGNQRTDLRVWCYDDTHANRRWSVLKWDWPGAPAAFLTGSLQVLDDVNAVRETLGVCDAPREFLSVACIPVQIGGISGQTAAVVSIDVRQRRFFSEKNLRQQLLPLIAPAVTQIGVVLTVKEDVLYAFER